MPDRISTRDIPGTLPFLSNGVTQVAQVVKDLEATVEGYWRLFGIAPWSFYVYDRTILSRMTYRGKPADYSMHIALSYLGPTRIELIQVLKGPTVLDEFIAAHGYGVQHFGVLTDDMEASLAQARAAGIEMLMDGAGFGLDGDGHYAYLDTEKVLGITVELISRPKRRRTPEKVFPAE